MVVHMIAVDMMQPAVVHEIDVPAMLNGRMLLARMAMHVIVAGHPAHQFFSLGIGCAHFKSMFVDMAVMSVMEVAVMEEIDVAGMCDRLVTTAHAMNVPLVSGVKHLVRQQRGGRQSNGKDGQEGGSSHKKHSSHW